MLLLDSLAVQYLLLKCREREKLTTFAKLLLCAGAPEGGTPRGLLPSNAASPDCTRGSAWDRELVQDPRFCSGDSCPPIVAPGHSPVTQGCHSAPFYLPLPGQVWPLLQAPGNRSASSASPGFLPQVLTLHLSQLLQRAQKESRFRFSPYTKPAFARS